MDCVDGTPCTTEDGLYQVSSLHPGPPSSSEEQLSTGHPDRPGKRRRSDDIIDLTMDIPTPEEPNTVNHPAKKLFDPIKQMAREVSRQLESQIELNDAVFTFLAQIIFAISWRPSSKGVKACLLDTLWFEYNKPRPQSVRNFTDHQLNFLLIYHEGNRHWTLCVSEIKEEKIHFHLHGERAEEAKECFEQWIGSQDFDYDVVSCQEEWLEKHDDVNCGVYLLLHFQRILTGETICETTEPTVARDELLDIIIGADINSCKALSSNDASILRIIQWRQCGLDERFSELDVVIPSTPPENDRVSQRFVNFAETTISRWKREQLIDMLECKEKELRGIDASLDIVRIMEREAKLTQETTETDYDDMILRLQQSQPNPFQTDFSAGQEQSKDRVSASMAELVTAVSRRVGEGFIKMISQTKWEKQNIITRTAVKHQRQIKALSVRREETNKCIAALRRSIQLVEAYDEFESGALGIDIGIFF